MKMKFGRLSLASVLLLGGLTSLTACGEDDFKGLSITFWHTFGHSVADGVQKYANAFAKKVLETEGESIRIVLKYKSGYDQIKGDITKSLATSDNPTIAVAYPDHIADYFAAESFSGEFVVDMEPYATSETIGFGKEEAYGDAEGWDDFIPAFREESTSYTKDGIYSLPFLKSTESMLYNFDLVKKAMPYWDTSITEDDDIKELMRNLTWDQLMDFCETIVANKANFPGLKWPVYYDSDANLMISDLAQKDIPYSGINEKGQGYIGFNGNAENPTPEQSQAYADVLDELTQYKTWYNQGLFMTKGIDTAYSSKYFTQQQVIFSIGSTGGSGYSFPSAKWNIESVKVPYHENNPLYVSQGPTVCLLHNKKLQRVDQDEKAITYGWKFLKYMTNKEVNAGMCVNNSEGYMPVRDSAYATDVFKSFMAKTSNPYTKVAKTIVDDIDGRYLSTAVFKGSAALRDSMADIFATAMKSNGSDAAIKKALDDGISNAVKKM